MDASKSKDATGSEESEAGPVSPPQLQLTHKSRRPSAGQQQLAAMDRLTRTASAATVDSVLDRSSSYLPPSSGSTITRRVLRTFHKHNHSHSQKERLPPPPPSANPSRAASLHGSNPDDEEEDLDLPTEPQSFAITVYHALKAILLSLCTPITGTLVLAIVFSLVSPLKALFVPDVPGWSGTRIRLAPDGRPPLAFIQDTASFVGAMCVPGCEYFRETLFIESTRQRKENSS